LPFAAVPSDADNNMYIARGAVEPVPLACLAALSHHRPPPPHQSVPLSLHDALPICDSSTHESKQARFCCFSTLAPRMAPRVSCADRKSTRLNPSHVKTSYAVFSLKKNSLSGRRKATTES